MRFALCCARAIAPDREHAPEADKLHRCPEFLQKRLALVDAVSLAPVTRHVDLLASVVPEAWELFLVCRLRLFLSHSARLSLTIWRMSPLMTVYLAKTFLRHSTMAASGLVHLTHSTNAEDIFGLS